MICVLFFLALTDQGNSAIKGAERDQEMAVPGWSAGYTPFFGRGFQFVYIWNRFFERYLQFKVALRLIARDFVRLSWWLFLFRWGFVGLCSVHPLVTVGRRGAFWSSEVQNFVLDAEKIKASRWVSESRMDRRQAMRASKTPKMGCLMNGF